MFETIEKLKKEGKKIGFTCSTFDLLHAGHIAMLSEAKAYCDFLVVGLLTDPTISRPDTKNKPVQDIYERFIQLQAVKYVDMIIPFDTEENICDIVRMIEPDIRFVGEEYKDTKHTGWDLCPIMYNKRKHNYSTAELRNRIKEKS
jgi:glycerol-3-phosphate cytidylyltransferase